MMRLTSEAAFGDRNVLLPGYDRGAVTRGVVHLGVGAFQRAHQATYFEAALRHGDGRWGITGASLRSAAVRDSLNPQGGLYTVVERDGTAERLQVVGAIGEVLVAPEDPAAVIRAMASADAHLVTLTVTEKGYKLDPASGDLLFDDPDVAHDCLAIASARTAPGLLVAALRVRRDRGLPPFTAISCDNLPENGRRLRKAVLTLAARIDPALADWIAAHGAFPQTMVDRIVPATTPEDIAALGLRIGVEDRAMVKTEPFSQWVIEDAFCGQRPELEAFGAQITRSVAPWEDAKLRLLNGAHSAIAYLGGLAGLGFVHQVVALPEGRRFVEALWDEATATLTPPPGLDVPAYRAALMARFANAALQHKTRQIAMDGSQKLPQRLLASIAERRARGDGVDALALGVAAWMRWQQGVTDAGERFAVDDPLAAMVSARLGRAHAPADRVAALMAVEAIFPRVLAADADLQALLARQLTALTERGALATLRQR